MNGKFRKEIEKAYLTPDLALAAVLSFVVLWFKPIHGIICLALSAGLFLFHRYVTHKNLLRRIAEFKENVLKEREDIMDAFSAGAPLLLCVLDKSMNIHWSNAAFDERIGGKEGLLSFTTRENLKKLFEETDAKIRVVADSTVYSVTSTYLSAKDISFRVLFWQDVTELEELGIQYADSVMCLAYINIDNFDEILQNVPAENKSKMVAQIDGLIFDWAKALDGAVFGLGDNRYGVVFRQKHLFELKKNGFDILDRMHEIEVSSDFPASLSIGVSVGEKTLAGLQEKAQEAIELALGRGGDQAVVHSEDGEIEYFGGNLPSVEKRNKGKSRVMAHALMNLINESDKVFIMGHARPDMDCFGASVGIHALASNLKKKAYIILEKPGDAIEEAYKTACAVKDELGHSLYNIIDHETARTELTSKSLLILVDHHRKAISEDPGLVDMAGKIALFDHHRKAGDAIDGTVLSFMESYASSSCELIAEILQYAGERGDISKFEAEVLLGGINLDTKNFTTNTGVRTFDAAAWLKRKGADNSVIRTYFKTDLSFYQKKINVIANAEILSNGVAVAYTKEIDPAMQLIVSQVADELLMMKGVNAAIAAGRNGTATMVSARSNGKYNVQTLMEKLGGGGHQTVAAVQLAVGPEEAISQIVQVMRIEGMLKD